MQLTTFKIADLYPEITNWGICATAFTQEKVAYCPLCALAIGEPFPSNRQLEFVDRVHETDWSSHTDPRSGHTAHIGRAHSN